MHKVSRVIIVVVHVGAVKIYVAAELEALKKKGKDRMKFSLPPKKLVEILLWFPSYYVFVKFSFPFYTFDALLCRN